MDTYPVLSLSGKSFSLLREEGRKSEKEEAREGKKGVGEGVGGRKRRSLGRMEERRKKKEKMEGGEDVEIAHRLRGLCVGPGGGLSGPLAFLCSLAPFQRPIVHQGAVAASEQEPQDLASSLVLFFS